MAIAFELNDLLTKIELVLLDHEITEGTPPGFTDDGFGAIVYIFSSALMDRAWRLQENENMSFEDRCAMVKSFGNELRKLIKIYTNVDMHDFFE
jgi:hypothetical protein